MRKRVCLVLAVLCLLWALPVSAGAEAAALPALDSAGAVYLYHVESGRAVGRKSETDRRAAGASVKLLSGLDEPDGGVVMRKNGWSPASGWAVGWTRRWKLRMRCLPEPAGGCSVLRQARF